MYFLRNFCFLPFLVDINVEVNYLVVSIFEVHGETNCLLWFPFQDYFPLKFPSKLGINNCLGYIELAVY